MPRDEFKSYYGYNPWQIEILPQLGHQAIPRELQESAYAKWKQKPSPESMAELLKTFSKLVNAEVGRYQGTLERPLLQSFAKKYMIDAIKSYKPQSGTQLSTHIVNNLQRLHRLNYRNVQGLHLSEEVQRKINNYLQSKSNLAEELGRHPNLEEIAERMKVNPNFVKKIQQQMKVEVAPKDISFAPQATELDAEEETLDLLYHDLPDIHKKILEHSTGYGGADVLEGKEIGKRLGLSPVRVTQIRQNIANKLKSHLGHT